MINVDAKEEIIKLDSQLMYRSIEELGQQINQAWSESTKVNIPFSAKDIKNIIVVGMGGSALGARIIATVYLDELHVPMIIYNNYNLPKFVDENTLFICSAYSGTTEEPLDSLKYALEKKAKIIAIASGETLIEEATAQNIPYYLIQPDYNPCGQPRMALGYSITGQLGMLHSIGLINVSSEQIDESIKSIQDNNQHYGIDIPASENEAKKLAQKIYGRIPLLIASGHLGGAVHASRNQFNENGKNYATTHVIPELNHHLLEGLVYPQSNSNNLIGIFIDSKLYDQRNQKRLNITIDIMERNKIPTYKYTLKSGSKLSQAFEALHFLSYVNYYLALCNGVDPSPIPWVDYFKQQLAS